MARIFAATAASGIVSALVYRFASPLLGANISMLPVGGFFNALTAMLVAVIAGLAALYLVSLLLKIEEADKAAEMVLRRLKRRKPQPAA